MPLLRLPPCCAGEKFGADGDAATSTAMKAIQDAAAEEAKQRLSEKAAKKAAFNAEYDVGELALVHRTRVETQHCTAGTLLLLVSVIVLGTCVQ